MNAARKDHDCGIPLVGGPFCGECLTMRDGCLTNKVPLYHEYKFHVYELVLEQFNNWTRISYKFTGEILEIGEIGKYKADFNTI